MTELLLAIVAALLAGNSYFIKKIFDKTESLEASFRPITPAIVEIQGKFSEAGHTLLFPLTVKPGSPLQLTDYGHKLIEESGFLQILDECRPMLIKHVKAKKPTTNYDIQQDSLLVIKELLESDAKELKPLKEYAFENGLSVDLLVQPAGIMLRDEVMKELKF